MLVAPLAALQIGLRYFLGGVVSTLADCKNRRESKGFQPWKPGHQNIGS